MTGPVPSSSAKPSLGWGRGAASGTPMGIRRACVAAEVHGTYEKALAGLRDV